MKWILAGLTITFLFNFFNSTFVYTSSAICDNDSKLTITYERTGGYSGIPLNFKVNTSTLSQHEKDELCPLINRIASSNFHTDKEPDIGADQFIHSMTIESENGNIKKIPYSDFNKTKDIDQLIHLLHIRS